MRTLIISLVGLVLLIGSWLVFSDYANDTIGNMADQIETRIIVSASQEDWDAAQQQMNSLLSDWNEYKGSYAYFLNTEEINQTDFALKRVKYYIEAKDLSNTTGELAFIRQQMLSLHENEKLTLENLF